MRACGRGGGGVFASEPRRRAADAADAADRDASGMPRTACAGENRLPRVTDSRRVTAVDAQPTLRWRNVGSVPA